MSTTITNTNASFPVSEMAENLIGSEIIKLANEVNEKIRSGEKIANLTIGDFDPQIFPIPQLLLDEIIAAYKAGHTNYPVANGMLDLRKAVSEYLWVEITNSKVGNFFSASDFFVYLIGQFNNLRTD